MNEGLVRTYLAGAVINKNRVVKFDTSDSTVVQAAAVGDLSIGVCDNMGATAAGDPVDVILSGIANVEYGGTITRGAKLTVDSVGRVVSAAPSAGANNQVIGIAMLSGVIGDIGKVHINPCTVQG